MAKKAKKTKFTPSTKVRWVEPGTAQRVPLPKSKTSTLRTIHDFTPAERENIEIYDGPGQAKKWRWKPGYDPQ